MIDDKQMKTNRKIHFMFTKNDKYVVKCVFFFFCFYVKNYE